MTKNEIIELVKNYINNPKFTNLLKEPYFLENNFCKDVKDNLPEFNKNVIVICNDNVICVGCRYNEPIKFIRDHDNNDIMRLKIKLYENNWNIPNVKFWLDLPNFNIYK